MLGNILLLICFIGSVAWHYIQVGRKVNSYKLGDIFEYESESVIEELYLSVMLVALILGCFFLCCVVIYYFVKVIGFLNHW